ncbi:MAG: hypothetical protein V3R99_04180 [Thermoguttaceae bacterium]
MCRFVLVCLAVFGSVATVAAEELVKPAEYLASLRPPTFSKTHTLPPLTRYGWTLSYGARVEFARNWGYTLELGGYVTEKHIWSKQQPAYEFPTGDADVRVLVRKRRDRAAWLVAAWAAGGAARDVNVTIPEAGEITLKARPGGSVYVVRESDGKMTAQLMDLDPMKPSLSLPSSL